MSIKSLQGQAPGHHTCKYDDLITCITQKLKQWIHHRTPKVQVNRKPAVMHWMIISTAYMLQLASTYIALTDFPLCKYHISCIFLNFRAHMPPPVQCHPGWSPPCPSCSAATENDALVIAVDTHTHRWLFYWPFSRITLLCWLNYSISSVSL